MVITRRDFLGSTLLASGAALLESVSPAELLQDKDDFTGYGGVGEYSTSNGNTLQVLRAGRRVKARAAVMAGGSWTTKHIVKDLPATHRDAYGQFYRSPCMMANIAVRSWRFLYKMGMSGCRWFEGIGNYMEVRKLALSGIESPTISPDSPVVLSLKVLYSYPGYSTEEQGNRGRAEMMRTSFREYETRIREQFTEMFG